MKLVKRDTWGARKPRNRSAISSNVKGVGIHWVGPGMGTWTHDKCAGKVRGIQNFHMDANGWSDIAYSHLACPHGYIFEGRKWGVRTAANGTNTGNTYYHAICYLGGQGDPFTEEAKAAIREYVERHQSIYGDEVRPHSWFKSTGCPGDVIRKWIADGLPLADAPLAPVICDEQILKRGDYNDCVKEAQQLLLDKGYDLGVWGADGDFGETTETRVIKFQRTEGLTVDGIIGSNTWEALRAESAPPARSEADFAVVVTAESEIDQILAYVLAKRWAFKYIPFDQLDDYTVDYVVAIGYNANVWKAKGRDGGMAITGPSRWDTASEVLSYIQGSQPDRLAPWS